MRSLFASSCFSTAIITETEMMQYSSQKLYFATLSALEGVAQLGTASRPDLIKLRQFFAAYLGTALATQTQTQRHSNDC